MSDLARVPGFHAVLLAGGSGTRFWPLSRSSRPKQFLALGGGGPLLVETWNRIRRLCPPRRIWVVSPASLAAEVRGMLPGLRPGNLIVEPAPRDTAPAVALACRTVADRFPGAVVGIFPTDHVVRDTAAFARAVRAADAAARKGVLVCLGIRPDRPATGYGYLKCAKSPRAGRAVPVERFVEKPTAARARAFLRTGKYLWNAGMFVWRVDRFDEELRRTSTPIRRAVARHVGGARGAWARAPRQSVDYAVMERARDVRVVPLDAGWCDVGSWDAASRLELDAPSASSPDSILIDSPGSAVFGSDRFVALVDVPDVVVVDTPDALLVVGRTSAERVREVVEELRRRRRRDLL